MTTDDFREYGTALINQLLAQGFERPITFTAIASDGLTTAGSSETITGTVLSGEKTTAPPGAFARYLLPIHLLLNWLRVLGTAELPHIDQGVRH
jgi:hypothetical protein